MGFGVFTLSDTETDTETDDKWVVYIIVWRDRHQHRFPLGSVLISVPVLVSMSVSVSGSFSASYIIKELSSIISFQLFCCVTFISDHVFCRCLQVTIITTCAHEQDRLITH